MKILFVCENYFPHYGGAEVLFKNLAEGYVKQGNTVSVITQRLKKTTKTETINGVHLQRAYSFFSRYLFSFLALPRVIAEAKNYDVIQTTTFNGAFPAWIAAKIWRKPVVITIHEVWIGKWQEITGFSIWKSRIHELLERMIYLLPFDRYICVSDTTRKDLLQRNIPEEKVKLVYNGFDYSSWNKQNFSKTDVEKIRTQFGEDKFIYFAWGRPGASKGFEYFIQAAPSILEKIPNALFVLMLGSVDKYKRKYQELQTLLKTLNLEGKFKIINSVPYSELGNYILAADSIIVPSISEGFGYTTVEATTLGKSVLISDAGSLLEVVSGKHNVFRRKDIPDLAEKAVLCAQGKYKEATPKQFTWEKTIEGYLQQYNSLLRGE